MRHIEYKVICTRIDGVKYNDLPIEEELTLLVNDASKEGWAPCLQSIDNNIIITTFKREINSPEVPRQTWERIRAVQ